MAENKKSFILYTDQKEIFEELTNEEAGVLIKHIFKYVNDEDPELEDRLLKIAFEPIKQQLKRDLKEWENKKGKKSDSGKTGNLKRWHPDLNDMVLSGEITEEEAWVIANDRKISQCDNSDRTRSHPIANIAVNVNDNVTVTDNTPNGVGNSGELPPSDQDLKVRYKAMVKTKPSIFNFIKNEKPNFIEPFADFWNLFADEHKLPRVVKINDSRKKKFNVRIRDPLFNLPEILRKANTSQFILTSNWFTFDWIIENETNFLKVLEGNYDSKQKADAEQPENRLNAQIKQALAGN